MTFFIMSESKRVDYIKSIVDNNQELLALVTQNEQNVILFKLQINIQDQFPIPELKYESNQTQKFHNPTPCQYAIIADKPLSLKGLINFLCNQKPDYHCFALEKYQNGLKLEIASVFCPTVSNTTWPLLHLAIALGRQECLEILINFLTEQGALNEFINRPDDRYRTPLSIAFATGIKEIIDLLLEKGADPYYGLDTKTAIMPIIFACANYPQKLDTVGQCIRNHKHTEKVFQDIEKCYFDEIGFAYSENGEDRTQLKLFLGTKSMEAKEFYSKEGKPLDELSTASGVQKTKEDGNSSNKENDDDDDATPGHVCCIPGCGSTDISYCTICEKSYCNDHNNEEYHKHKH